MLAELPVEDLHILAALLEKELDHRLGREKFALPEHVVRLLN